MLTKIYSLICKLGEFASLIVFVLAMASIFYCFSHMALSIVDSMNGINAIK